MDKKIILVGKSCSGKSHLAELLKEANLKVAKSTTSRPIREYETDGVHYNFITKESFEDKIEKDAFVEYDNFNSWYYGLSYEEFENADVIVATPGGVNTYLQKFDREKLIIIFIEIPIALYVERLKKRGDVHDSMYRRYFTDEVDFQEWQGWDGPWDLKISVKTEDIIPEIIKQIKTKHNI